MKKWIKILLVSILAIIAIAVAWEFIYVKSISMKQVFIFPKNFKGIVFIFHNQADGIDIKKEDGKFIYRIPQNGVLKIKAPLEPSLSKDWYYFEDDKGNRTEFYYSWDRKKDMEANKDKVYAFGLSTGSSGLGEEQVDRTIFLVGTERETDSLSKVLEKLNPIEILKTNK